MATTGQQADRLLGEAGGVHMWSEGQGLSWSHSANTPPTDSGVRPLGHAGAGAGVVVVVDGWRISSESFDRPGKWKQL